MFSHVYHQRIRTAVIAAAITGATLLALPMIITAPAQAASAADQAAILQATQEKLDALDLAIARKRIFIARHPNTQGAELSMVEMQSLIQQRQQTIALASQLLQESQQPSGLKIGQ